MELRDIHALYAYNRWANLRMLSAVEKVTPKRFTATVQSSFSSLQESVFHIFGAEWIWLKRWTGASPRANQPNPKASWETWAGLRANGVAPPQELGTVAELKAFCDSIEQERQEFLSGLTENVLQAPLSYTDMAGTPFSAPLFEQMQHVVNHGSYHRGQVTTLLRQAGADPITLDMLYFFREEREKAAGAASE